MKTTHFKISCLSLLLLLTSCGKSSESKDESVPISQSTEATPSDPAEVNQRLTNTIASNDVSAMENVIRDNTVDLNQTDLNGETPLMAAIRNNATAVRDYLIQRPVDLNEPGRGGMTALMAAVEAKSRNSVRVLLDRNVRLDKKNEAGDTALHLAIKTKQPEIALDLINAGANIDITDNENRNAFRLAEEHELASIVEVTRNITQINYGAPDIVSFKRVVLTGDVVTLRSMLQRFPDIAVDYENVNPLALTIDITDTNKSSEVATLLLDSRVKPDGPRNAEIAPLIKATINKKMGLLDLFLSRQANVQITDGEGLTALAHAVTLNDEAMVAKLLSYRAQVKYRTRVNGRNKTIDTCDIARAYGRSARAADKITNTSIKERLDCGFWDWLF
jgi:ankyrin repeat protein